ncbi:MAG: type I restriction endonuclease, partial [Planctomycetota bacterium]
MELGKRLSELSDRARSVVGNLATEEATKTALVLPFLGALGYDVFDPTEVVPEFTADVGVKRGEKVDYAVCVDGKPQLLIECKPHGARLDSYGSQLYRYFSVTPARVAVLTDGVEYRFYSDLMEPNKLDPEPFMRVLVTEPRDSVTSRLALLSKGSLDVSALL